MAELSFILLFCIINTAWSNGIEVEVEQGWLSGELKTSILGDTYYSFKGIPYAKPPVGSLRFKAPKPPIPWSGVRDATKYGSVCPQVNLISMQGFSGDEDCLFLNVYSPSITPDQLMSVMLFIYGGTYEFGSGDDDLYGPDFFIRKGVLLVTINYRVDNLGFLNLNTKEVPGNAGLRDQQAALKWVNKNIENFGGNPNSVTIFGESAGAASVVYHTVSPMSKGLFHRGIVQSGVPSLDGLIPYKSVARSFLLGKLLGFETRDVDELHKFLLQVPKENLTSQPTTIFASEEITSGTFRFQFIAPVIEKDLGQERFLVEDPFLSLKRGNVNDVDILFGYTNDESLIMLEFFVNKGLIDKYNRYQEMFVPSKISIKSTPDTIWTLSNKIIDYYFGEEFVNVTNVQNFVKYANLAYMVADIHRLFDKYPDRPNNNIFCYKFNGLAGRNYYGNRGAKYGIYGTSHFDDIFYLFDPKVDPIFPTPTKDSKEFKIIDLLTDVFTNFAKYGNPTPDSSLGVSWPTYNTSSRAYVEISHKLKAGTNPDHHEIQFWRSVYEHANIEF